MAAVQSALNAALWSHRFTDVPTAQSRLPVPTSPMEADMLHVDVKGRTEVDCSGAAHSSPRFTIQPMRTRCRRVQRTTPNVANTYIYDRFTSSV